MTKRIRLNGTSRELAQGSSIAMLVRSLVGEEQEGVAVAVNGEIVTRSQWPEREVHDGDDIEIVRAVQGG
ncbi:MAG: sulfur carrier protein ThiS [Candidatus Latescibacterota bacterium]|nr:MAG: sulfur carrier protein ThiS [Candidatus Latescibacterota bacterium]